MRECGKRRDRKYGVPHPHIEELTKSRGIQLTSHECIRGKRLRGEGEVWYIPTVKQSHTNYNTQISLTPLPSYEPVLCQMPAPWYGAVYVFLVSTEENGRKRTRE